MSLREDRKPRSGFLNAHIKISLSDVRIMILSVYPLSTEEHGHLYYHGDGVDKSVEEAYVWYHIA